MKQYWVYILANRKDGVLYTGVTNNLAMRISQHKAGTGSSFTKKYRAVKLVYAQSFSDIHEAIAAEKLLKKWRRSWKTKLIEKANPEWEDLFNTL